VRPGRKSSSTEGFIDIDKPEKLVGRHCPERTVVLATDDPRAINSRCFWPPRGS